MAAGDDWHERLAREVALGASSHETVGADAAALEIEFGRARSAITYALELSRAHRVPVAGNVAGDDVWMKLGDARARFLLNRRDGYVAIVIGQGDEVRAQWNAEKRALIDAAGNPVDLGKVAREAIDTLIADWRKLPSRSRVPVTPNREDEPTKG
jgi:hypothetical protein